MKLNRISWTAFYLLSLISLAVWLKYSYPQLAFTNISIDRTQAIAIAKDNLHQRGIVNIDRFLTAAVFSMDDQMNRYMQKTVGFSGLKKFIEQYDFDLFFWRVKFCQENEKEEFHFIIDTASGEITGFSHVIDDNEFRPTVPREEAQEKAQEFLIRTFGFQPEQYTLRSNLATLHDNRSDYFFSWQNVNVSIPWSDRPNSGTGKLVTSVRISGDDILGFSKNSFSVPDQFGRDLDYQMEIGRNIMTVIKLVVLALLTSSIFLVITRQNHLAMHATKKFYLGVMLISLMLSLITPVNQFQHILFGYQTTQSLKAFLWRNGIDTVINALLITVAILIPSLAGELLHFETSRNQRSGALLHYVQTTFASRHVGELIVLGYFVCFILLGIQSFLVKIGQTFLGVWVEHSWLNNSMTAYLPFLAAFTFGYKTAFSEEIMYRLYGINLGKKLLGRLPFQKGKLFIICLFTSLIWGLAHSSYPIFPMWFRGLEVTCLGLFLSLIYLKFGLIPVIVAHYLFDVYWNCTGYLFGIAKPVYFYSSLGILLLPLALAAAALLLNRKEEVRPLRWHLNRRQCYNLEILKVFLNQNQRMFENKPLEETKKEIVSQGWDPAVVEVAVEDFFKGRE